MCICMCICTCMYSLPIGRGGVEILVVEESVRGKKKEAVVQCALKACRILDSNDMLHAASKREPSVYTVSCVCVCVCVCVCACVCVCVCACVCCVCVCVLCVYV